MLPEKAIFIKNITEKDTEEVFLMTRKEEEKRQRNKERTKIAALFAGTFALFYIGYAASKSAGLTAVTGNAVSTTGSGMPITTLIGVVGIIAVVIVTWNYLRDQPKAKKNRSKRRR